MVPLTAWGMTEVIQKLPSLCIPGVHSLQPSHPSQNKPPFQYPTAYSQAFKDRLPPVALLQKNAKHLHRSGYSPNYWSYGTSYLVTLLFNGQLPKSFLDELCSGNVQNIRQRPNNHRNYVPRFKREVELWEPKHHKELQKSGRRVEQKIMEARWRQRKIYEDISTGISSKRDKVEKVILKRDGTIDRGKQAYLDKLEKSKAKLELHKIVKIRRHHATAPILCDAGIKADEICDITETGSGEASKTSSDLTDSKSSE